MAFTAIKARNQLETEVVAKDRAVEHARQLAYASEMNSASQALRQNNLRLARALIDRNRGFADGTDLRNWEWRALWRQCKGHENNLLANLRNSIRSISIASSQWMAVSSVGEVQVWNLETGKLIRTTSVIRPQIVGLTPSGDRLYIIESGGAVKSLLVPSLSESAVNFHHGSRVRDACTSSDGKRLAIFGFDEQISLWDLESPDATTNRKKLYAGDTTSVGESEGRIAISPDNRLLAIGLYKRTRIVDLKTLGELRVLPHGGKHALAFSPDGQYLAIRARIGDSTVYLYSVTDGELVARLEGHSFYIKDVEFSPDGRLLASASADQTIVLWDVQTTTKAAVLRGHVDEVTCLKFTADGHRLITASRDGDVRIWDPHQQRYTWPITVEYAVAGARRSPYSRASFSFDGKYLATRNQDDTVRLRSGNSLKEIRQVPELGTHNRGVRFSPVASILAAGDAHGHLLLVDPDTPGDVTNVDVDLDTDIVPIGFSQDGRRLLAIAQNDSGSQCIVFSIPDAHDAQVVQRWDLPWRDRGAALSPDGELVATRHDTVETVCLWKVSDPREPILKHCGRGTDAVAFSPDGKTLVAGSANPDAKILDVSDFSVTGRLRGHVLSIHSATFSPDGTRLATGGSDEDPVKIWDLATGQELMTLFVEGSWFRQVEFSPDGNAILAISTPNAIHLWQVPTLEEIELWKADGALLEKEHLIKCCCGKLAKKSAVLKTFSADCRLTFVQRHHPPQPCCPPRVEDHISGHRKFGRLEQRLAVNHCIICRRYVFFPPAKPSV